MRLITRRLGPGSSRYGEEWHKMPYLHRKILDKLICLNLDMDGTLNYYLRHSQPLGYDETYN